MVIFGPTEITGKEAFQVFEGCVLSDAKLFLEHRHGLHQTVNYQFKMALSDWEHADWLWFVRDALEMLDVSSCPPKCRRSISHGKPYKYVDLRSNVSVWLSEQRQRWYPDGTKEVPEDFKFTPLSLANEFMGDGTSSWNNNNPESGVTVELCTQGFNPVSIGRLERQLEGLGISHLSRLDYSTAKGSTRHFAIGIIILGASTELFMDVVEPYILPSYRYKIKREGTKVRLGSRR